VIHEPVIVIDLEATGLAIEQGDRLTEIALVRVEDGRIVAARQSLVDCGVRVPSHITAYTGISQAMVDGAPPVAGVLAELLLQLGDAPVVAHGAGFDEALLRAECERAELPMLAEPFLCTLALARAVYPSLPNHSLAALAHALEIERPDAAHRAGADAALTARLLLRIAADVARRDGRQGVSVRDLAALTRTQRPAPPVPRPAPREARYA
jgi:DNA polymerase III subunit epsilon